MGYMMVIASCVGCKQTMTCNPDRVPSIRVEGKEGRQPVCAECHKRANVKRKELGLELWPEPHPDAYGPEECI